MKSLRLSALIVLVAIIVTNQTWVSIGLVASKTLDLTGADLQPSLMPLLIVATLSTLLAMYIRRRSSVVLLVISAVSLSVAVVGSWPISVNQDASAATGAVAKASGVVGWIGQKDSVITSSSITAAPALFDVVAVCAIVAILLGAAKFARVAKRQPLARPVGDQPKPADDLWSETNS